MDFLARVLNQARDPWALLGFTGQSFFALRFVVQWIASERARRVVIPTAFWYLSLVGTALTMGYAYYKADPVFILATTIQAVVQGPIYIRNLVLAGRGGREKAT